VHVLLINDTRCDHNPGCQGTVSALARQISMATHGDVSTRPRGDGCDCFADLVRDHRTRSPEAWDDAVQRLARNRSLVEALASADLVVANLEGTFHDHTIGALALGGALALAHRMGKRVWAVNGTIEGIDDWLLDAAVRPAEYVAVREPRSVRWLADRGLTAVAAADCAFLIEGFCHRRPQHVARPRAVLYTPGVLASLDDSRNVNAAIADLHTLVRHGWDPVFLQMADGEAPVALQARASGWPVVDISTIDWHDFGAYLRQFELVVSGRYHVLLFAAMAGVPAIALPSNTFKIDGLLERLGTSGALARTTAELQSLLSARMRPAIVERSVIRHCQSLARMNVPGAPVAVEGLDWVPRSERSTVLADLYADGPDQFQTSIETPPSTLWRHRLACAGFDVLQEESCGGRRLLSVRRARAHCTRPTPAPLRTALFGASSAGRASAARWRGTPGIQVQCFLDNDPAKWLQELDGIQVLKPDVGALDALDLIIPTSIHAAAIVQQVTQAGYGHTLVLDVEELTWNG